MSWERKWWIGSVCIAHTPRRDCDTLPIDYPRPAGLQATGLRRRLPSASCLLTGAFAARSDVSFPTSEQNIQIMIRLILKVFLLMTLTVAAGSSSVSHAQQSTTTLTGEWVGNSNLPDRSELVRLSLTEDAGEIRVPLSRFSQKLTLVLPRVSDPP